MHGILARPILLLCCATLGSAQGLGVTFDGEVILFDPFGPDGGVVVETGLDKCNAFARGADGRLWAVSNDGPGQLFRLNPVTFELETLGHPQPSVTDVRGLAVAPWDPGLLFSVEHGSHPDLWVLGVDPPISSTLVGQITHQGVQALTFADDGTLYAWSVGYGLLEIDPWTGASINVSGQNDGHSGIQSLSWFGGQLYGLREETYLIDIQTGQSSVVPGTGPFGDVRGAEMFSGLAGSWTGCPPTPNSAGSGAHLAVTGGNLSMATNDTVLGGAGYPGGQFAMLFFGDDEGTGVLGDGALCVQQPIARFSPTAIAANGVLQVPLDFQAAPLSGWAVQPGATTHFQVWHRDVTGAGSNSSQSLVVIFAP